MPVRLPQLQSVCGHTASSLIQVRREIFRFQREILGKQRRAGGAANHQLREAACARGWLQGPQFEISCQAPAQHFACRCAPQPMSAASAALSVTGEAVYQAAGRDDLPAVAKLLAAGAPVDYRDSVSAVLRGPGCRAWRRVALRRADPRGCVLSRPAAASQARRTALMFAALGGPTEMLRLLLDHGAEIEARSEVSLVPPPATALATHERI